MLLSEYISFKMKIAVQGMGYILTLFVKQYTDYVNRIWLLTITTWQVSIAKDTKIWL